jgi:hypothetical protein
MGWATKTRKLAGWLPLALTFWLQPDASILLGSVERDLTGDGRPELLRVTGVRSKDDRTDATLSIESDGQTLYEFKLAPLTRTVGFDAGRRVISAKEYEARLRDFGRWFFAAEKFEAPSAFIARRLPATLAEIPEVIERDRSTSDARSGPEIWDEILRSPVTIFSFSPGGDRFEAIAWSVSAGRFYRLVDCC